MRKGYDLQFFVWSESAKKILFPFKEGLTGNAKFPEDIMDVAWR